MNYSVYSSDMVPRRPRRRLFWWILILLLLGLLGWFTVGPFLALKKIQDIGSGDGGLLGFLGRINSRQLKGEEDGRVNFLIIGLDDAAKLADTIQVVSIAPQDKKLAVMSIPRDLNVCTGLTTTKSLRLSTCKINEVHSYGERFLGKSGGGAKLLKDVVGEITGQTIHYYGRMDFDGFVKLVDALGGIDVYVEKAINDPFYPAPDQIHYDPFRIASGWQHLDGKTALKYVRSRETTSDFDRSRRQQQAMIAIKDKATSLNVLTNPRKINEIATILGNHVKTDLSTWEMARAIELAARDGSAYALVTRVLSIGPGEPLISVNQGVYYLVPRTGNFKEIRQITENIFDETGIKEEAAKIELVNASGRSSTLSEVATTLKNQGFQVTVTRTTETTVSKTSLYDYSGGTKPNTIRELAEQFRTTAIRKTRPSALNVDITLIIGLDYLTTSNRSPAPSS